MRVAFVYGRTTGLRGRRTGAARAQRAVIRVAWVSDPCKLRAARSGSPAAQCPACLPPTLLRSRAPIQLGRAWSSRGVVTVSETITSPLCPTVRGADT